MTESNGSKPTTAALREEIEATRAELGQTVQDLTAKADVKQRVKDKTATVAHQAADKAAQAKDQVEEALSDVAHRVQEATPEPVRQKAAQAKNHVSDAAASVAGAVQDKTPDPVSQKLSATAEAARRHRPQLLAAGVVAAMTLVVARRGSKRR